MPTFFEPDQRIPSNLRDIFGHLKGELVELHQSFEEFHSLYLSQAKVEVLNKTAPVFFARHQAILANELVLSISRLTDPNQNRSRNKENLTFSCLLDDQIKANAPALFASLELNWSKLSKNSIPVRFLRNKRIAHTDLATRLTPESPIGKDVTVARIRQILAQMVTFLNAFEFHFTDAITAYDGILEYGNEGDLVQYLRDGLTSHARFLESLTGRGNQEPT